MTRRRARGFTLLEVLIALAIFAFVASAAMTTMADSEYMGASGRRARELRLLAERKMGELLLFEKHFDDLAPADGQLDSDYPEYGDRFKNWKWNLDIRDVVVFGVSSADDAQYLFGQPSDDDKAAAAAQNAGPGSSGTGGSSGQPTTSSSTTKLGKTQELRELTLRVSASPDEGGDSVTIIVFAPKLAAQTPTAAGAAKSGG